MDKDTVDKDIVDKNNNDIDDRKEAFISYGVAGIGLIMAVSAFYIYKEFQLAKDFFYVSVLLSGLRDGVEGLKRFIK